MLECSGIVLRSFGQHTFDRRRVGGTRSDVYVSENVVNIVPLRMKSYLSNKRSQRMF